MFPLIPEGTRCAVVNFLFDLRWSHPKLIDAPDPMDPLPRSVTEVDILFEQVQGPVMRFEDPSDDIRRYDDDDDDDDDWFSLEHYIVHNMNRFRFTLVGCEMENWRFFGTQCSLSARPTYEEVMQAVRRRLVKVGQRTNFAHMDQPTFMNRIATNVQFVTREAYRQRVTESEFELYTVRDLPFKKDGHTIDFNTV
jgi:hypothetical protein